jgi:hypothetical protein
MVMSFSNARYDCEQEGISRFLESVSNNQNKQTFLFIEMINKAGNLCRGMAGIEPTPFKS